MFLISGSYLWDHGPVITGAYQCAIRLLSSTNMIQSRHRQMVIFLLNNLHDQQGIYSSFMQSGALAAEDSWNLILCKASQYKVSPSSFSGTNLKPQGEFIPCQPIASFWVQYQELCSQTYRAMQPQPWTQSPSKSLRSPRKVNSLMPELFREGVVHRLQANYINTNQGLVKS